MMESGDIMHVPLIGVSKPILKTRELIQDVANTCLNVLVTGETGVGKEVVAQNLYIESARSSNNFVKINCAALPETLLESELYGFEKGAFTDAHKKRSGKFQMADKGVLFLDEIGDMPLTLQSKMLHVLQSGEFSPLGSDQELRTDVWVIAATNHNLEECVSNKTFREDLFYRLNIINIDIPPLRERKEDIPVLIEYFHNLYQSEHPAGKGCLPTSSELTSLCDYSWPGNVRQLQNSVNKRLVFNSWDQIIKELSCDEAEKVYEPIEEKMDTTIAVNGENECHQILSQYIDVSASTENLFEKISLKKIKKQAGDRAEKEIIAYTLNEVGWNKSQAARLLKISYKSLLYKTKKFKILQPVSEW